MVSPHHQSPLETRGESQAHTLNVGARANFDRAEPVLWVRVELSSTSLLQAHAGITVGGPSLLRTTVTAQVGNGPASKVDATLDNGGTSPVSGQVNLPGVGTVDLFPGNSTGNPPPTGSGTSSNPGQSIPPGLAFAIASTGSSAVVPPLGLFATQSTSALTAVQPETTLNRSGQLFNDLLGVPAVTGALRRPLLDGGGGEDIVEDFDTEAGSLQTVPVLPGGPEPGVRDQDTAPIGEQDGLLPDSGAAPLTPVTAALDRVFIQLGRDLASWLGSLPLSPWATSLLLAAAVLEIARQRQLAANGDDERASRWQPLWRGAA